MTKTIYGIYDAKAAKFTEIIVNDNYVNFIRTLKTIVNSDDRNNFLVTCTTDFSLHKIGEIDDVTGQVVPLQHEILLELQSLKENYGEERKGS